jgi:hypothetical protein
MKSSTKTPINQTTLAEAPQHHEYPAPSGIIPVIAQSNEIWMSQKDMARMFNISQQTVSYHIKNVIAEDNLDANSVIREIRYTASDGKSYLVAHYSLDVVLPVGYRVGSPQASEFRKWANNIIREYLTLGVVINKPLLESRAQLWREKTIAKHERANLGDTPEIVLLRAQNENAKHFKSLMSEVSRAIKDVKHGKFINLEYVAMFGKQADDLRVILNTKNIRDTLGIRQITLLTMAEIDLRDMIAGRTSLTMQEAEKIIDLVVKPLGERLRTISLYLAIDPITGQSLLESGKD